MEQWVGNAHEDPAVRCLREKRMGHFDFRGGQISSVGAAFELCIQ